MTFGAGDISDSSCLKKFSYSSEENTTNVFLAGEFNDWNTTSHPLTSTGNNAWELDVLLDEPSAYKFVVEHNGDQHWTCDPSSDWFQCDEGQAFENSCELGISSCNSIASTSGCNVPTINVDSIETIDTVDTAIQG